jgi:hypothetical protein
MTDKLSPKEQFERFKKAARELGCDEDKERFERKLGQIATAMPRPKKKATRKGQNQT